MRAASLANHDASACEAPVEAIRRLHLRDERERSGLYYGEGLRFVASAVAAGAEITTLLISPATLQHPFAARLVRRLRRHGTPVLQVGAATLASLSILDHPQGIGAVVRQRWEPLDAMTPGDELCWLGVEIIQSPGNLGSMLRTSQAVGGGGLIRLGDDCDPYDPRVVRASMGAASGQRYIRATVADFARWKRKHGILAVGTSQSGSVDYHRVSYPVPTVVLVGWERKGLSRELQRLCDVVVRIPMVGSGDSLNVAAATAIVLYELLHQHNGRQPDREQGRPDEPTISPAGQFPAAPTEQVADRRTFVSSSPYMTGPHLDRHTLSAFAANRIVLLLSRPPDHERSGSGHKAT